MSSFEETHPWLTFSINLSKAPAKLWVNLGECKQLSECINGASIHPSFMEDLEQRYLTQGTMSAAALDGNTLTEQEVRAILFDKADIPSSKMYLAQENLNILSGYTYIIKHVKGHRESILSVDSIREFNRIVLDRMVIEPGIEPGLLRSADISIPTHRFKLTPPEECIPLLEQLCLWLNSSTFDPPPSMSIVYGILKAIMAHLYLAWIHPFDRGNARTTHLVEFLILIEAGLPAVASIHFSRFYQQTKYDYYKNIESASSPKSRILPFIMYSVQGFLDALREQTAFIKQHQFTIAWENFVNDTFREKTSLADIRRKHLALDLARVSGFIPVAKIPEVSTRLARYYSAKTAKTLSRDIADLIKAGFIIKSPEGVMARLDAVRAFASHGELP